MKHGYSISKEGAPVGTGHLSLSALHNSDAERVYAANLVAKPFQLLLSFPS